MKKKRWISLLLLVVLVATSVLMPADITASMESSSKETLVKTEEKQEEGEKEKEVSEEKIIDPLSESLQKEPTTVPKENDSEDKTETDDTKKESEENNDEKAEAQEKTEGKEDSAANVPQGRSLLPLKEVKAYLVLNDKTTDELKNMSIDEMLDSLQDKDGNKIAISESATTVWRYVKDEVDNVERYDSYTIGSGATFDLSAAENILDYQLEIIVGDGKQLNAENVRYIIKVYVTERFIEEFTFEVYAQPDSSTRYKMEPDRMQFVQGETSMENYIPQWNYIFYMKEGDVGVNPYLGISASSTEHPDIDIDIYRAEEFLLNDKLGAEIFPPITDQILDQNMEEIDAGYRMRNPDLESFIVVYYIDGVQVELLTLNFVMIGSISQLTGDIYMLVNGEKVRVANDMQCNVTYEEQLSYETYYFKLNKGYSADDEYYVSLNAIDGINGDVSDKIQKVVIGHYSTIEEAEKQEDIKEDLFSDNGYKANYGGEGIKFTAFFNDTDTFGGRKAYQFCVQALASEDLYYSYTEKPIIGAQDPWFRITGASYVNQSGEEYELDTYVVENGKNINMDTMYGYGYQTVLINDSDIDLTKLRPVFWTENPEQVTDIRVVDAAGNQKKIISGDEVNCDGTVQFIATIDGHQKNYMVNFVKKSSDATLFVAGPSEREVFLDEYFEYKHDIFIANVGETALTGLKVELDATNCKLDNYWTVGGEGNDTLEPFTSTSSDTEYGTAGNIAKIRLVPDGEGDINGTLKIYADGQEPVTIKLSGRAQNPKITTEKLDEAVKYVPYSYMVTTNNMYDWTDVEFSMTGELPEGVEFIQETGEIYGVPQETGTFPVTVTASFTSDTYEFDSSTVELTLNVQDNTNANVYESTDEEYQILESIGEDISGDYDFVLTEISDQLFVSNGEFDEFQDLWLNGEKLVDGVDYTKEEGSTRITISSQTFENKVNKDGTNTLAAEFRVDSERENELKRTAQNFRLDIQKENPSDENPEDDGRNPGGDGTKPGDDKDEPTGNENENNQNGGRNVVSPSPVRQDNESDVKEDEDDQASVTIHAQLVDKENSPLDNYLIEIRSTPKEAYTNDKGMADFNDVEFGAHTLTVKDPDGKTAATKKFTIKQGKTLSLDEDVITAKANSAFTLKITLDGKDLTLTGVKENAVRTGDVSDLPVWFGVFLAAGMVTFGLIMGKKQRVK